MMDCAFDSSRLQDFVDERLGAPQRHEVADHLADCEVCRKRLGSYSALDALLTHLPVEEPPEFLVDRVMLAIDVAAEADEAPRAAPAELARTAVAVFAVLLGAAALVYGGLVATGEVALEAGAGVVDWTFGVVDSFSGGLTALFAGLGRVLETWAALPSSSLSQTAILAVALGALAVVTNLLATRAGGPTGASPTGGRG